MTRERIIKKAQRTRKIIDLFYRFKGIYPAKKGTVRMVDTKHGKIRVLEYGLENKAASPLFIDLHGGGFIFMHADMDESMNLYFLKKTGVKIISIDYPKAPENAYPIASKLKGLPPALIILAGGDSLHDEGAQYAEMLKKSGVPTALHEFPNAAHGFTYWRSTDTDNALALIADFINKNITDDSKP